MSQKSQLSTQGVIEELGYPQESGSWFNIAAEEPGATSLFRLARMAGVDGAYCFQTSPIIPHEEQILPPRAAVYVATAYDEHGARQLHRRIWNVGDAPFLLVVLPHQVRVYTGFNYKEEDASAGLIAQLSNTLDDIRAALSDFYAVEINDGRIWKNQAANLTVEKRVDYRLLASLRALADVLIEDRKVSPGVAHSLIGKYIYIRYLMDRQVLAPEWLSSLGIDLDEALGSAASVYGLKKLTDALDDRFNGEIFPIPLSGPDAPDDTTVSFVASVFRGDDAISRQLALDFQAYDFSFIPIELLSSIYEQFLHVQNKGVAVGAFYTPEPVADYLLCELNHTKPLKIGMEILDPCCGSGIFLVLAYRRLLEQALAEAKTDTLPPGLAKELLVSSIYGVERNSDACYVAEFSLLLTMLSYVDLPQLHHDQDFRFPTLHNHNIFEADFFDPRSTFRESGHVFDWVVGNPPWIDAKSTSQDEQFVVEAIRNLNLAQKSVAGLRVCDAFTWAVDDFLKPGGMIGLLIHATSLTNLNSQNYRRQFFAAHRVVRVTNFSNLAYVLFAGRAEAPAATIIYTPTVAEVEKPPIVHYGPFVANQISNGSQGERRKPTWSITINEGEIQSVSAEDAEQGDALTWKLALWGTYRDKRYLERLKRLFPKTLTDLCHQKGWELRDGVQLRRESKVREDKGLAENFYEPRLRDLCVLDADEFSKTGLRFSVPDSFLAPVSDDECYIRKRGGSGGLKAAYAPHLYINTEVAAYSDDDFVVRNPQIYLSAPRHDAEHLRALSALLNSSIMKYMLFFQSASWGIDRNKLGLSAVKNIPVPSLTPEEIGQLAALHRELASAEASQAEKNLFGKVSSVAAVLSGSDADLQERLDQQVEALLRLPRYAAVMAREFTQIRLQFNKGKVGEAAARPPTQNDLEAYASFLQQELDGFGGGQTKHKILITKYSDLIECTVTLAEATQAIEPSVHEYGSGTSTLAKTLWDMLAEQFSQWVYVQRGLRVFDGRTFKIYKAPRLMDWIKTKALQDADDIIAEVLTRARN